MVLSRHLPAFIGLECLLQCIYNSPPTVTLIQSIFKYVFIIVFTSYITFTPILSIWLIIFKFYYETYVYEFLISAMCVRHPSYLTPVATIILITNVEKYKLRSFSLCSLFLFPIASSPFFHLLPANTFSLALLPFLTATDEIPLFHKARFTYNLKTH
jgi:hypothetical protein